MTISERALRPASTIRGALTAGFAVVFGVWVFAGYELIASLGAVERQVAVAIDTFAHNRDTLSSVRQNVLLGSLSVRDAVVDSSAARDAYRDELRRLREAIEGHLEGYQRDPQLPMEAEYLTELETNLTEYWDSVDFVFSPTLPTMVGQSVTLLRTEVLPRRDNVTRVLDNLRDLQRISLEHNDERLTALYASARTRFLWIVSGALALGLAIAGFASRHVSRLEREIHRQRLAEADNRQDLERLSARLVDAQEQERRSLARELHDEVGQALTAIKMEVGVAMRGSADQRVRASLDEARSIAESTLQSVRDLSQLLHPSMLDDFGLPETLAAYLRNFSKRTGIRSHLTHDGLEQRLPGDVEVCLYRIVQEALTNVARHSGAASCSVRVERRGDQVQLTIEDQGRGLTAAARIGEPRRGLGLIGMRERAQSLSGRFAIENRAEGGVRVAVTLPVPVADAERMAG